MGTSHLSDQDREHLLHFSQRAPELLMLVHLEHF